MSSDSRSAVLSLRNLTISFSGINVVSNLDLDLFSREIHAITGENGAGKSSAAKAAAGVYKPASGTVLLDGKQVHFNSPKDAIKAGVALIHQEPLIFPDLNVAENIFVGSHPKKAGLIQWKSLEEEADRILKMLGVGLSPRDNVGGLSIAQQQMVELAAAISHDARVWIFDETTASLTPKEAGELFEVMHRLKDQGSAIAMVTHHLNEIFANADRITVLRDGEKVAERIPSESTTEEVIQLMVGREVSHVRKKAAQTSGEPLLEVKNLSGAGFDDVSFTVSPGEIVGVAGLVGAGRTETVEAIFGITQPSQGEVKFEGQSVSIRKPADASQLGIALVPEDRQHSGLLLDQSIAFNASLASLKRLFQNGWVNGKVEEETASQKANEFGVVKRSVSQRIGELSGGNQQKVVIAKWLLTEPKLLILDEPTRGIDVGAKEQVHNIILDQAAKGVGVLMISSHLPEVISMSDRILVMRSGRIVGELKGDEATEESIMALAAGESE